VDAAPCQLASKVKNMNRWLFLVEGSKYILCALVLLALYVEGVAIGAIP
jgi:hypothetical protein